MLQRKLHLIAPAGPCRPFFQALKIDTAAGLLACVQEGIGPDYHVTGNESLIGAREDEDHGGRDDDEQRAADIENALADSDVAAILLVRGGAWFTRILPRIDTSVLDRRSTPIALFGFSELTTLVNMVGAHPNGRGIYDMGPAFLKYGLRRYAEALGSREPEEWMREQLHPHLIEFLRDVVSMIEGRGSERLITAKLIDGELPDHSSVSFVGGNLTVLTTLVGTPYRSCITPARRWLVIEDLNEKPERLDRLLAHLTLSGFWDKCQGLLLGDFHKGERTLTSAVAELLKYHLPPRRRIPVLMTEQVGHIWPMSPLPLHAPVMLERVDADTFSLNWAPSTLKTA